MQRSDEEARLEPSRAVSANVELVQRVVDGEDVLDFLLSDESGAVRDHGVSSESRTELGQASAHCERASESAELDGAPNERLTLSGSVHESHESTVDEDTGSSVRDVTPLSDL